jgi:UDP-glucuronate 4-epimerase
MRVLVTGCAGFIGMHCALRLLGRGDAVLGADNLSPYYDVGLKQARLERLAAERGFRFERADLADAAACARLFDAAQPERVLHLAAQPGVRYSLENPASYIQSNLVAFANVLEACRRHAPGHLVYASSSSVYGANAKLPWSEDHNVDHPISLYAATKKANELMAHVASHLHGLAATGLRYFTVYGPWGRPDMSPWLFTSAILEDRPIDVFNHGKMRRDFTYVEDIAEGTVRVMDRIPQPNPGFDHAHGSPAESHAPYRVYNIGNHQPVELMAFIGTIETALGKEAKKNFLPMQPGDVEATYADIDALKAAVGFEPKTPLDYGIGKWVAWYRQYTGH